MREWSVVSYLLLVTEYHSLMATRMVEIVV